MTGKNVLITGAAGGIGTALCRSFHEADYYVIGAGRTAPEGVCDAFVRLDLDEFVGSTSYQAKAVEEIRQHLPGSQLTALINNAAIQILGSTENILLDDWQKCFRVNVTGPFTLIQNLLPELEAADGSVINISSIHSRLTKPGFVTYATTKAALEGLTRALAVDVGNRVRVNAISPAAIRTPMLDAGFEHTPEAFRELEDYHPSNSLGSPNDVAELAVCLASAPGRFLNGAIIGLDGGIASRLHDPS